jgi:hypothetical protein
MKITIYELLGMIKDGKLKDGTKIRCSDFPVTYVYKNGTLGFYCTDEFIELTLRDILENINYANYKILEEEKKIPEKISLEIDQFEDSYYDTALIKVASKIDELIDYLEYLKTKGE